MKKLTWRALAVRSGLTTAAALTFVGQTPQTAQAGELTNYIRPEFQTGLRFGDRSHWIQPWRGYMETMPASQLVNGVGVNLNNIGLNGENPDLMLQHLAKYGIKHGRIEIGWNQVNWAETTVGTQQTANLLRACQKWGVRPLILLNSNHGAPCPAQFFNRTVTATAPAGTRTVQLNDVSGLVIGKSGFSNVTTYKAAEIFVTAINGNTVTLSKPLPQAMNAGQSVPMATLKYQPFSVPGSAASIETTNGWKKYMRLTAQWVREVLNGGTGSKEFDMEIWNELSFGSDFLNINFYYDPPLATYNAEVNHSHIVEASAEEATTNSGVYTGATFVDGFPNTTPWRGAGNQPARVGAISKHPYPVKANYPADEKGGTPINALGQIDTSGWKPTYSQVLPEYYGTALQTEHLIRDTSPISTEFYGVWKHGRYFRGQNAPVWAWMTEIGIAPDEMGVTDPAAALNLKGRAAGRYLTFFLNKGMQRIYFFGAIESDAWLGVVRDNFVAYSRTNTTYPANDSSYTSPMLQVTGRIVDQMKDGLDANLTLQNTRAVSVKSIADTHDNFQFNGDGTAARPKLFNREVLAILPFQVNATKFVIPYYVMTRNILNPMTPENYVIDLGGLRGNGATVSVYDPVTGASVPVTVQERTANSLKVLVSATDTPRLLTVQEAGIGLTGRYYQGQNFTTLVKAQTDPQIDFNWGPNSPKNLDGTTMSSVGPDNFSVRWTGVVEALEAGTYTFETTTDDGVRLWLGTTSGNPLINQWIPQGPIPYTATIALTAKQRLDLKMEYFENGGGAFARLRWKRPGQSNFEVVPQAQLFP